MVTRSTNRAIARQRLASCLISRMNCHAHRQSDTPERPTVAIVLCTWRPGPALDQQIDSCLAQTWPCQLIVHDDASGDDTPDRVRGIAAHRAQIRRHSDNMGFVGNFSRGITDALALGFDYIALADQDDIWHPDKVRLGMLEIQEIERQHGVKHAALIHSDLSVIDQSGQGLHASYFAWRGYTRPEKRHLPTILGQCCVMGNTTLFNRALAERALPFPKELFVHDWWLGILAELYGSRRLLSTTTVQYRLHDQNSSNSLEKLTSRRKAAWQRLVSGSLKSRDFRLPWREDNRADTLRQLLDDDATAKIIAAEDRAIIEDFIGYLTGQGSRVSQLVVLIKHGFLKPSRWHRVRLSAAVLLTQRYDASSARVSEDASGRERAESSKPTSTST